MTVVAFTQDDVVRRKTQPAEFVTTSSRRTSARHVIAPSYLLNAGLTFGAISDIPVPRSPPIKVAIDVGIALASVPCLPTLEAHLKAALAVDPVRAALLRHEPVAVRPRAPLEVRISAYVYVFFEL